MRAFHLILFIGLGLFFLYLRTVPSLEEERLLTERSQTESSSKAVVSVPEAALPEQAPTPVTSSAEGAIPQKVLQVLQIVRTTGEAPEGYVGGRVFQNREGLLPYGGSYREFDVDPHHGGRNAERIIVEWRTKKAWYTADHYQSFIPLP